MTAKEYNQIVEQYANNLYRYALHITHDDDWAHDIVQDSFEKLWRNADSVAAEKAKSYMFSIAHNAIIDTIRKNKRQVVTETELLPQASHCNQYSDLKELLDKAVALLPEAQRSALLLRDYEGYSYQDIADITGLSESQVKVYIYRARVSMKKYIGKMDVVI